MFSVSVTVAIQLDRGVWGGGEYERICMYVCEPYGTKWNLRTYRHLSNELRPPRYRHLEFLVAIHVYLYAYPFRHSRHDVLSRFTQNKIYEWTSVVRVTDISKSVSTEQVFTSLPPENYFSMRPLLHLRSIICRPITLTSITLESDTWLGYMYGLEISAYCDGGINIMVTAVG